MARRAKNKKTAKHRANKNNLQKTDYAQNLLSPSGRTPTPTREISSYSLQGTNELFDSSERTGDVSRPSVKEDNIFTRLKEKGITLLISFVIGVMGLMCKEAIELVKNVAAINEKLVSIEKEIENISVEKADEDIVDFQIESIKKDIQEIKDDISEYVGSR